MTQIYYSSPHGERKSISSYPKRGSSQYYLMLKNEKVALFSMTISGMAVNVLEIYNQDKMPIGTRGFTQPRLNQRFLSWKQNRCTPKSRHDYEKIENAIGCSPAVIETINMGISLTDCYWFCPVDENYSWEDVNYHDNGFSEDISNIILNDQTANEIDIKTPDVTTNGVLPKSWVRINGKLFLVKIGSSLSNQEVCNEVFASIMAEKLGLPVVPYYISKLKDGRCCSLCESFINNDNTEFVSMQQISVEPTTIGRDGVINFMNNNKLTEFRNKMIVFDYLIANQDRHFGNFGFLRDAESLQIIGPAPLFDFDKSMNIGFWDVNNANNDIAKPFAYTHAEQIKLVSNLNWVNLEEIKQTFKEDIEVVYSAGGFSQEEIKRFQDFFEKRIEQLEQILTQVKEAEKKERVETIKNRIQNSFKDIVPKPIKMAEQEPPPKKYTTSSSQDFQEISRNYTPKSTEEMVNDEIDNIDTFDTVDWGT